MTTQFTQDSEASATARKDLVPMERATDFMQGLLNEWARRAQNYRKPWSPQIKDLLKEWQTDIDGKKRPLEHTITFYSKLTHQDRKITGIVQKDEGLYLSPTVRRGYSEYITKYLEALPLPHTQEDQGIFPDMPPPDQAPAIDTAKTHGTTAVLTAQPPGKTPTPGQEPTSEDRLRRLEDKFTSMVTTIQEYEDRISDLENVTTEQRGFIAIYEKHRITSTTQLSQLTTQLNTSETRVASLTSEFKDKTAQLRILFNEQSAHHKELATRLTQLENNPTTTTAKDVGTTIDKLKHTTKECEAVLQATIKEQSDDINAMSIMVYDMTRDLRKTHNVAKQEHAALLRLTQDSAVVQQTIEDALRTIKDQVGITEAHRSKAEQFARETRQHDQAADIHCEKAAEYAKEARQHLAAIRSNQRNDSGMTTPRRPARDNSYNRTPTFVSPQPARQHHMDPYVVDEYEQEEYEEEHGRPYSGFAKRNRNTPPHPKWDRPNPDMRTRHMEQVRTNVQRFSRTTFTAKLNPQNDRDRASNALAYYSSILTLAKHCGIGLLTFPELNPDVIDYFVPSDLTMPTDLIDYERAEYASVIGLKVVENIENEHFRMSMQSALMTHHDGYRIIQTIMTQHVPLLRQPHDFNAFTAQTRRPTYDRTAQTIFGFEMELTLYYQMEGHYGRNHRPAEKTNVFLSEIASDGRYEDAVKEARQACPANHNATIPPQYMLGTIGTTIAHHSSVDPSIGTDVFVPSGTRIHKTEAIDTEDDPHIAKTFERRRRPPRPDVQCKACKTYGHDGNCDFAVRTYHSLAFIKNEPKEIKRMSDEYIAKHDPANRAKVHAAALDIVRHLGLDIDMDTLTKQTLHAAGDTLAVCRVTEADQDVDPLPTFDFPDLPMADPDPSHDSTEHPITMCDHTPNIHPQALKTVHLHTKPAYITLDHEMEDHNDLKPHVAKMVCTFPDEITQGDTGANRGLTNDRSKLKSFQLVTPFQIGTIGPHSIMVTGKGIMSIPTMEGHMEDIHAYYSADASGSVISPDRHVYESQGRLTRWIQWGDPESGQGAIIFLDQRGEHASTIRMYRRNGLWYARVGSAMAHVSMDRHEHNPAIRTAHSDRHDPLVEPPNTNDTDVLRESIHVCRKVKFQLPPHEIQSIHHLAANEDNEPLPTTTRTNDEDTTVPFVGRLEQTVPHLNRELVPNAPHSDEKLPPRTIDPALPTMPAYSPVTNAPPNPHPKGSKRLHVFSRSKGARIITHGIKKRRPSRYTTPQCIVRHTLFTYRWNVRLHNHIRRKCRRQSMIALQKGIQDVGMPAPRRNQDDSVHIHSMEAPDPSTHPQKPSQLMTEIWHQRMGHIGLDALHHTAQCTTGINPLGKAHPLFKCQACQMAKMTKATKTKQETRQATQRGERFHMDFGFVRGPKHLSELTTRKWMGQRRQKDEDHPDYRPLVTSHDGYSSYLLIVDAFTRTSFVYLTKSKDPPIDTVNLFLQRYGTKQGTIRTDQGGELARSKGFRSTIATHGYTIEPTGADNSSQNGRGERPHRTLANMVRCMLYSSTLGAEFWSDALVYACYIYNRTYHSAIKKTPFEAWGGTKPDLKHIKTFGTPVTVKKPGRRPSKLSPHVYHGIFLRFTGTTKNIVYYDIKSGSVKVATHKTHDEFQYGSDYNKRSHASKHIVELASDDTKEMRFGSPHLDNTIENLIPTEQSPPAAAAASAEAAVDMHHSDSDRFYHYIMGGKEVELQQSIHQLKDILNTMNEDHPQIHVARQIRKDEDILQLEMSIDAYGPTTTITVDTYGDDDCLGFQFHDGMYTPTIQHCIKNSPAARITRWRSRFRHGTIRYVNTVRINTIDEFRAQVNEARRQGQDSVTIRIAHEDFANLHTGEGIPQLHFDQLQSIAHHLNCIRYGEDYDLFPTQEQSEAAPSISKAQADPPKKLTRKYLQKQSDWKVWKEAEWKQLDAYKMQNMFGDPIPRPPPTKDNKGNITAPTVLPFVWTYLLKDGVRHKARGTCNGGKRFGKAVTLAHTYASCVEQPASRLFWALATANGMTVIGADAGNAFAEAPPPKAPLYLAVDAQYQAWWTEHLGNDPIPKGYVLPVQHAIQGHPESPRLWEQHINSILLDMGFKNTTHERCIYRARYEDDEVLFLRQVDDFAVACKNTTVARKIISIIGKRLTVPLNQLGIINKFNGLDVKQTKHYTKLYCESYLNKVLDAHGWQETETTHNPLPMRNESTYQAELETATPPQNESEQKQLRDAHFNYRQVIGEAIYAMVTCRPDISFAVIKLAQYASNPAEIHYKAARHLMKYLALTKDKGIIYWRKEPINDLPDVPPEPCVSHSDILDNIPHQANADQPIAYCDSDWAQDRTHRRSVTGLMIMLAGGVIAYKSKYQSTVSLSSTEAEFTAAAEAGKMILYIQSILDELGYGDDEPTILYADNMGALFMATADQPTKRTKHMDTKTFVLQDWIREERLTMEAIRTQFNVSDHFTKALGRIKFYEQTDVIMGRRIPTFSPLYSLPSLPYVPDQPTVCRLEEYDKVIAYIQSTLPNTEPEDTE